MKLTKEMLFGAMDKACSPPEFPRGGPDMPPKTDPFDVTTPDGRMPAFIPPSRFKQLLAEGQDMRWYASARLIPRSKP